MPTASYVPPTPVPTQCCACTGAVIPITSSCPAYTTASPVMAAQGLLTFEIPLLLSNAIGTGNFNLILNYMNVSSDLTSNTGTTGFGFNYTQNILLVAAPNGITLQTGENTQETFVGSGNGLYSSAANNTAATLTRTGAGTSSDTITITSRDGVVSVFWGLDPSIATPGRLKSVTDRFGNTQTHVWQLVSGQVQLASVTDSYGRTTSFTYYGSTQNYQLQQVTDFWGRQVNFQYDSAGRLTAVVGPSVTRGANSNANTFPNGTAYVFQYDTANPRPERRNDLIKMWYPNQVAPYLGTGRTVNVSGVYSGATPRRQVSYYNDPTDTFNYGKVQQVIESATGSGSVGSGAWGYTYLNTGLPANKIDPTDPIVSETIATDRNGNQTVYDFNAAQMLVHKQQFATRGKNSLEASSWETWTQYNSHNQPVEIVYPEGNSVQYTYEDETNTIQFGGVPYAPRIGLMQSMTKLPGNTIGIPSRPGSNGQTQLTELYFNDPLFNNQCAMIEARGNPIDASGTFFTPQNGGTTPTSQDRSRYTTINYFDYQKDTAATVQADTALQAQLGLTSTQIGQLITYVSQQMNVPTNQGPLPAGFEMGIGDVNGEGTGAGTGTNARHTGAVVQVKSPAVRQLAPTGSGTYPQTLLPDSPLAYWRLDESSGTTANDSSGNGNAATYTGGYTLGAAGLLQNDSDTAVSLNGSSGYVSAGNPTAFQITTGSVEAWIKTSGAGSSYRGIVTKQNAWGLYLNNNVLGVYDFSAGTFQSTGVNLADGNPHHVVFTFSVGVTNGSVIYIDGQSKLTFTLGSSGLSQGTELELGNGGPTSNQYFAGTVDEAAVYNTVLSATRVLAHYTAGSSTTPWVWQSQSRLELYTNNALGQQTTYTNPEGNLTVYVRFPQNNPDGDNDVYDPGLSNKQYGRVKQTVVDADPSTVMTLVGSDGDMITFIGNKIPRTNTPGIYQNLTTTHQGATGCTMCNYDPLGNVLTTVDARGNLTKYDRNELGEVYRVTSPAPYSYQVETSYDANRNVIQVDTQDMVVQYNSSDPSDPGYAQFTPTGSGTTANVPMQAGSGGSVRPGWFSNLYSYDLLDNKTQDDIDATGSSPSSLVTDYAYDFNCNLIKITKPQGNTVEYDYDERNLRIATRVGYVAGSQPGSVTVNAFDGNGNLLDTVGPAQRGTASQSLSVVIGDAFNGSTNVTYTGDWLVQNTYDGFDRMTNGTDAIGNVTQNTYDPGSRLIAAQAYGTAGGATPTDRLGTNNVLLFSGSMRFDEAARQYETQQDVFLNTGISGGVATHNVPSGRTITHTGGGLAANSTTNSNTSTVTLTTGGSSYVLRRQVFDRMDRLSVSAADNGAQTSNSYDGADRQISVLDPLGNSVQNTFDANSNVTATTRTERCTISSSIAPESFGSLLAYDVMNRRVVRADQGADGSLSLTLSDPTTLFTLTGYDSRNNKTNLIDPKLNTTIYQFDGASRQLKTLQHLRTGGVGTNAIVSTVTTQQSYDGNGRLTTLADNNGGTTQWTYDTLDRQASMIFHDGSTRTYGYDAASDLTSYTDENGSVQASTFDPAGRRTAVSITLATGVQGTTAQSFQYDGLSRQTFARDSIGSANADASSAIDSLSRTVEEVQTYGGDTRYVTQDKWASLPATEVTYPSTRQVASGYDLLYRRNSVTETSGGAAIAAWQFFGNRTALLTLGNGLTCSFMNNAQTRSAIQSGQATPGWGSITTDQLGYDGAARLIGKRYFNSSTVLVGFTAAYDKSSNKLFERPLHAESRASLYDAYDSMNRLLDYQRGVLASGGGSITTAISLPGTNQEQAYNLDGLGNWSTTTITPEGGSAAVQNRTHNKLNEVTQYGSTPVYYDQGNNSGTPPQKGNGNIIDDGVRTYAYDALNRLTTVNAKSSGNQIAAYTYDALGRRIQKVVSNGGITGTVANGTTRYLYSGQQCIEELVSGSTTRQFVWGQYIDELVQMKTYVSTGSQPLPAGLYYLLSDLLYRSTALTNSSAAIVEAYDTDAYGNTLIYSGPGTDSQWFTNDDVTSLQPACEYVYTGRQYDPETQIYFYRARYYHPQLGRFISRDPLNYLFGTNPYLHVRSAPPRTLDPFGEAPADAPSPAQVKDHNDCVSRLQKAEKLAVLSKLLNAINADKNCKAPNIQCICCAQNYPGAGAVTNQQSGNISICEDRERTTKDIMESLAHELVHAYDHCKDPNFASTCDKIACTEIRAVNISGQCSTGDPPGQLNPNKIPYQECVKEAAAASVASHKQCGDGTAAVNNVFTACFKDQSPVH